MIRRATSADIPRIVEMGGQFIETTFSAAMTFNGPAIATLTQQLIDGTDGVVFVSERDARVTGMMALITMRQPMSDETLAVELVWWVEQHGKDGLKLLDEASKWGRSKGATRLQMIAPSERVCQLYERLGFQKVEVSYVRSL